MPARPEFKKHTLNAAGVEKTELAAGIFSDCLNSLDVLLPGQSREKALVVTKLQEACFFAKRALAIQPENQES